MSALERPRILYVDDDPDQLQLVTLQLRSEFDVHVASSAEQALEVLGSQGTFAAVLSDMRMPQVNGAQLLSRVRELCPHTVRLLLTGDADLESAIAAVNDARAFRYLIKPCPRAELLAAVREAAAEHRRETERDGLGRRLELACHGGEFDPGTPVELYVGMLIAGRYRIEAVLGAGSTAAVFRCVDLILDSQVALKLFPRELDDESQERVRRELLLTRQLAHPNVVHSYDIGVHEGCLFITMELLRGQDLGDLIEYGPLPLERAIDYLVQACAGLSHAHALGVIHRDVKPENLFVDDQGVVHVMDLGLAKDRRSSSFGEQWALAGTLAYMSPEQIQDFGSVTHLTDVYAMGVVAYELLTGELPFDHDDPGELIRMHLRAPPRPPSEVAPVPRALDAVVLRALQKRPCDRFQSCHALGRALTRALSGVTTRVA